MSSTAAFSSSIRTTIYHRRPVHLRRRQGPRVQATGCKNRGICAEVRAYRLWAVVSARRARLNRVRPAAGSLTQRARDTEARIRGAFAGLAVVAVGGAQDFRDGVPGTAAADMDVAFSGNSHPVVGRPILIGLVPAVL